MFRNIEFGVTLSLGGWGLVGVDRASLKGLEGDMDTDERSMIVLPSALPMIGNVPKVP